MRHGTVWTYKREGCRCELCRRANAGKCARERAARAGQEPPRHGCSGYTNYGCRCEVCTEANKARLKAWHKARKAEAAAGEALATDTT